LQPVPAASNYRDNLLADPVYLRNTPDLAVSDEAVLEFRVPVSADLPEWSYLCARIDWGNPRLELNKRNNFSCSRLHVRGVRLPEIRYLFSGGFAGIMGMRIVVTAEGIARVPGEPPAELALSSEEHRRLVQRARAAVAAGGAPGPVCPDGFTHTLKVGEQTASENQCARKGPLGEMFDDLEELADRVKEAANRSGR
jgi:hypothetical protein